MRVIAGSKRGMKLFSPAGESVRPTMDQVKEAAFNIMQFDLPDGIFLDMFAGSGQMGIEALSRGAEAAYFFEPDRAAFALLNKNLSRTGLTAGAKAFCAPYSRLAALSPRPRFDLVYMDPPFAAGEYEKALCFLADGFLHDGSTVICEAERGVELPEAVAGFTDEVRRYGHVCLHIYRKREETE